MRDVESINYFSSNSSDSKKKLHKYSYFSNDNVKIFCKNFFQNIRVNDFFKKFKSKKNNSKPQKISNNSHKFSWKQLINKNKNSNLLYLNKHLKTTQYVSRKDNKNNFRKVTKPIKEIQNVLFNLVYKFERLQILELCSIM